MNKRQKKKKLKKEAWDAHYKELMKQNRELDFNGEGYRDSTAGKALRNLIRKGY